MAKRVEQGGIEAWQSDRRRRAARRRRARTTRRSRTRSTSGSIRARRTTRCCAARTRDESAFPGRPLPRRLGPAPRLVPFVAAGRRACSTACRRTSALLTHGFVVDGEGRKMSKSQGQRRRAAEGRRHARRRDPAPVGRAHRLLGRALDLRRDPEARGRELPPHPQHAALPAREHRRTSIPRSTRVPVDELLEIDRYALAHGAARWPAAGARRTTRATSSTSWSQQLQTFCSEDLGGFYLDILKDRLYTTPRPTAARGARRRPRCATSRDALLQLMAPILSFTAEEAWRVAASGATRRVFDADVDGHRCRRCATPTRWSRSWQRILARARRRA